MDVSYYNILCSQKTPKIQYRLQEKRSLLERRRLQLNYVSPQNRIREKKTRLMQLEDRLVHSMERILDDRRHRLAIYLEQFKGLSPLTKLNSGYSYVEDKSGKALKKVSQVHPKDKVTIHVTDGQVFAVVTDKKEKEGADVFRGEVC